MEQVHPYFSFVDLKQLKLNPSRLRSSESGNDIYILCPNEQCSGHGYLTLSKKGGACYTCGLNFKLHVNKYHSWSDEEICRALGVTTQRGTRTSASDTPQPLGPPADRPKLKTQPLSDKAKEYISLRGITEETLRKFTLVRETHLYNSAWLCWWNLSYGYELREIGGKNRHGTPQGSPKNITVQGVGGPILGPRSLLAITEGLLSAMSHYELTEYPVTEYIILNSVKMVSRVETYEWGLFPQVLLALDFDEAGMHGKVALAKHFLEKYPQMKITVDHPPVWGMDWNDYLLAKSSARR